MQTKLRPLTDLERSRVERIRSWIPDGVFCFPPVKEMAGSLGISPRSLRMLLAKAKARRLLPDFGHARPSGTAPGDHADSEIKSRLNSFWRAMSDLEVRLGRSPSPTERRHLIETWSGGESLGPCDVPED